MNINDAKVPYNVQLQNKHHDDYMASRMHGEISKILRGALVFLPKQGRTGKLLTENIKSITRFETNKGNIYTFSTVNGSYSFDSFGETEKKPPKTGGTELARAGEGVRESQNSITIGIKTKNGTLRFITNPFQVELKSGVATEGPMN